MLMLGFFHKYEYIQMMVDTSGLFSMIKLMFIVDTKTSYKGGIFN